MPGAAVQRIKGYDNGVRVFTNATTTPQRAALALGIDPDLKPLDALKAWMRTADAPPQRPVEMDKAAFMDNVMRGKNVDMTKLPAPYWHRKDGGPYIGSGSIVIMRDPDGGWINASIYRVQVHGKTRSRSSSTIRAGTVRSSQKILGQWPHLSRRGRERRGPCAVHRRLRVSAGRTVGVRLRRRDQGRAARNDPGRGYRPAAASPGRNRPRRRILPTSKSRCRKARRASSPAITPPMRGPRR